MSHRTLDLAARAVLAVGALVGAARAQSGFQTVLPPETLVFVGLDDAGDYRESLRASPLGQLWNDPACAELRQMVTEQVGLLGDEAEMALGVDVLRLPSLLEGPVAVALLDVQMVPGSHDPAAAICLLADVGPNAGECRTLLDGLAEHVLSSQTGIVRTTERIGEAEFVSFSDSRVDQQSGSRVRYGLAGPVAVVLVEVGGLRQDHLPAIVAGLNSPPARALAGNAAFAQSLAGASGQSLRLWADVGRIVENVHPTPRPAAGADPHAVDPEEKVLAALGLRDLGVLSMRAHCGPEGSYGALKLDWSGNGQIPRMLRNFFQPGDFPRLRYAPANARGVDALRIDLSGLFDAVVKMIIESGESPAEVTRGLQEVEKFLGFNPRDDLLELFDGEFVFVSGEVAPDEALPGLGEALSVAVIAGLRDAPQFSAFLEDLIRKRGLHVTQQTEEFEGLTIYSQNVFLVPVPICYAVVDDMLVVSGSPAMVRQIVHQRNTPDAPKLIELPAYREAVASLRPGYGLLGYSDAAADVKSLLYMLRKLPDMLHDKDIDVNVLSWMEQLPLPDDAVVDKYFHGGTATAVTFDESGLFFESAGP
jgi:hypothetical protein